MMGVRKVIEVDGTEGMGGKLDKKRGVKFEVSGTQKEWLKGKT